MSPKFVPKGSISLDNGLAPDRRQAIIRTNTHPIHCRINAALGGDVITGTLFFLTNKTQLAE